MQARDRLLRSVRTRGLLQTVRLAYGQFCSKVNRIRWKLFFRFKSGPEDRFTAIYRANRWGSPESVSGPGSTLNYTAKLRERLPDLIEAYSVRTVFDAPCGDFNWMHLVVQSGDFNYIGGDIVEALIDRNNQCFRNERTLFIHLDITAHNFPKADLMILRDCLFHMSDKDIWATLNNFVQSQIPYLLTTTHMNLSGFANNDISTGEFRLLDLFSSPFCFPRDPLERIEDWIEPYPPREMCLWSREQVLEALSPGNR